MSSTGIRKRRTTDDRADDALKQGEDGYIRKAKKFTDQGRAETGNVGPGAIGGASIPGASYLPVSGKYGMIGSIAFNPTVVPILDNRINITPDQSGASRDSSYVLLSGQNIDTLKFIDGASKNGQVIFLQGTQTQIHTLRAATIPSISLISGLVTVTVVTANNHNLTTGDKINILGTNNFNINDVDVTVINPTTFTYLAIGNVVSESSGTVQDGNFITETGDDVILDGTISPHGTGIIPIIFDPTIIGNGAWRPAQKLTVATENGGGGDLSEPVELGVNEVTTQILPAKTIVSGDIFNPAHIVLDQNIDIQLDISATTDKYKSIFIVFDLSGGGFTVTWPISVVNPPIIKDSKVERISVHLYTIDNGTLWTFATTVGSSSVGLQNLSELTIDVNKDWQALGISNVGPLTGVTTIAMTGASADITGVNQITMAGALPKIQGIEEMDFDGAVAKIQGLHTLEFSLTNNSIDDLTGGLDYSVGNDERHLFKSPNGNFLVLDEISISERRIDVQQNRITNIGRITFTPTFDADISITAQIFEDLTLENMRYISKTGKSHIFESGSNALLTIGNFLTLGGSLNDIALINLVDATIEPLFNGEIQMNGPDVKIFSGGLSRNISNISTGAALETDLSNMTSPTLPTVDLSLNVHQLTDVTNIIFVGTNQKIMSDNPNMIYDATSNGAHRFNIASVPVAEFKNLSGEVFFDMLSHNITNVLYIESNIANRPSNGFIRMATQDGIHIRNPANNDDLVIIGGNDALGNQALFFKVAGGNRLTVSQFDIDVIQNNIINTGDVLPSGTGGEVGNATNFYNQMHAQFFIAEAATPVTGRFGLAKTGNIIYTNFEDNHTDAGFGIFEQGVRHFLFSRTGTTPFVNEFAIAGTGALAGETYKIQMGNTGDNSASISLIEGDGSDLIINRAFSGTTPQTTGIQLQANGVTTILSNNIESKFFSNVNVNTQDMVNVVDIKSNGGGGATTGTIGELISFDGGFDYFMRNRLTWESNVDTYIEMNVNTLSVVSDADIAILANNSTSTNITIRSGAGIIIDALTTTMSLRQGSIERLQFASGVTTFSSSNIILTNGTEFISFLDAAAPSNIPDPLDGDITLFNDSSTGELSVKKNGDVVISLEGAGNLNTDLSNMTSPTLPTVDLSLNVHQLTDVTNIIMEGVNSGIEDVGLITFNVGAVQNLDQIFSSIGGQGITFETNQTLFFVPTGKKFEFTIGGIDSMEIRDVGAGVIEIDMQGNRALGFKDIIFDSTATFTATSSNAIGADSNGMILNVPTSDDYNFRVGNTNFLVMNEVALEISSGTTSISSNTINFGGIDTDRINFIAEIQIAPTYVDGVKQTFNPNISNAGINVGIHNTVPTNPVNGDIFYSSTLNQFRAYENGEWVELVGANQRLNNLKTPPVLNLNVLANRDTGGQLGANDANNAFKNVFTDNITFPNSISVVITDFSISNFASSMKLNVPNGAEINFLIGGTELVALDAAVGLILFTDLEMFGNDIIMSSGDIKELSNIIFDTNFTISTSSGAFFLDSLNATDTFNFRQGGANRLTFDNLGSVELSGGPTGSTRMSVNNGNFTVFAAGNGTDTEFICQSNTSLVFKEDTTEVARFNGGVNDWVFNPGSSFKVDAGANIELTAINGDIALTADGVIFVNSDIDFTGTATTDFGAALAQDPVGPTGSADIVPNRPFTYINIKVDGAPLLIPAFSPPT